MGKEQELLDALQEAIDLLAERKYGNPARSPGHNARLLLESILAARRSSSDEAEVVDQRMPSREWLRQKIEADGDEGEIGVGFELADVAGLERLAMEALPAWARDELIELRARVASPPPSVATGGVTEAQVEAAARTLAARAFARVSTTNNGSQIVDRGWVIYADDARAALTAALAVGDEGMGPDLLAELAKHVGWSIERGHEDSSDEEFSRYGWCVHEVSGNRSDREWRLVGFGETPREALSRAIQGDGE